jgi:hypothetical protein
MAFQHPDFCTLRWTERINPFRLTIPLRIKRLDLFIYLFRDTAEVRREKKKNP